MIELPEAKVLAGQLAKALAGRTVTKVQAAQSPHGFAFYSADPMEYPKLLEGLTVDGAEAFGGRVEMRLGGMVLDLLDGVNPRLLTAGAPLPKKHQLLLGFDDGSHLVCTVQMYGAMEAHPAGCYGNFYAQVVHERPDPLGPDFTEDYFRSLLVGTKPSLSAKAFLATEQRIPGLGNGVAQDILFTAGIHPKQKVAKLPNEALTLLYRSVVDTLQAMTEQGGRDTETDLFGQCGGYRCVLSKHTLLYPCPRCGGGIERFAYLGGNVYVCPFCQELK